MLTVGPHGTRAQPECEIDESVSDGAADTQVNRPSAFAACPTHVAETHPDNPRGFSLAERWAELVIYLVVCSALACH